MEAMKDDFTLMLGRKRIAVDGKVRIESQVQTQTAPIGYGLSELAHPSLNPVVSRQTVIYVNDKPFATTQRYGLRKDSKTGHMALRLYKNQTKLIA